MFIYLTPPPRIWIWEASGMNAAFRTSAPRNYLSSRLLRVMAHGASAYPPGQANERLAC